MQHGEKFIVSEYQYLCEKVDTLEPHPLLFTLSGFTEDALGRVLKAYFVRKSVAKELLGSQGGLGTLSQRAKACRALGLISSAQFKNIEVLRQVRNEFAHNWDRSSLEMYSSAISKMHGGSFDFVGQDLPIPLRLRHGSLWVIEELLTLESKLLSGSIAVPEIALD